jgi:hypothetical protein
LKIWQKREKQDKSITFSDRSGVPVTDMYDSAANDNDEVTAGVYDGHNGLNDGQDESTNDPDNEAHGIAIEQPDDDAEHTARQQE